MRTFIVKLAAWHRLFKDLEQARLRLAQAGTVQPRDKRTGGIEQDLLQFQRACEQALEELRIAADACIAAGRQQTDSTPVEKQPSRFPPLGWWSGAFSHDKQGIRRHRPTVG